MLLNLFGPVAHFQNSNIVSKIVINDHPQHKFALPHKNLYKVLIFLFFYSELDCLMYPIF